MKYIIIRENAPIDVVIAAVAIKNTLHDFDIVNTNDTSRIIAEIDNPQTITVGFQSYVKFNNIDGLEDVEKLLEKLDVPYNIGKYKAVYDFILGESLSFIVNLRSAKLNEQITIIEALANIL